MQDCDVCLSAGSVNQWGVCEVCGEEMEEEELVKEELVDELAADGSPAVEKP